MNAEDICTWTLDDDGIYHTECGKSFVFDTDGPKENGALFCLYCGKRLKEGEC